MNVLLAVDPSRNSLPATTFLEALRLPASAKLYLLYVEEPQVELPGPEHFPRMLGQVREQLSQIRQKTMEHARHLVNRLADPFHVQGLEIHPLVVEGIPGAQILTAIEQYHIDLVALGTKGLSGMKRFLLGSVSEWVLYDAPCSVLVVRGKPQGADATKFPRSAGSLGHGWLFRFLGSGSPTQDPQASNILAPHHPSCRGKACGSDNLGLGLGSYGCDTIC